MSYLSCYSKAEAAEILIIEAYKNNMINEPIKTAALTKSIVQTEGNTIQPILMMAKVNTLLQNNEVDGIHE